jgi:hypothetical protein
LTPWTTLAHHHGGNGWTYPGIMYLRGGDTLDGCHSPGGRRRADLRPRCSAWSWWLRKKPRALRSWRTASARWKSRRPGSAGNHDRTNAKPVSKKAFAHNYDRLIHKMLVNHFRRDKRVTFQTSESFDLRYQIYDQKILMTHGDRMSAGGGTGFIGPIANILKGWQKVTMEQAALGFRCIRSARAISHAVLDPLRLGQRLHAGLQRVCQELPHAAVPAAAAAWLPPSQARLGGYQAARIVGDNLAAGACLVLAALFSLAAADST